jgi:hypothetical protein
MRTRQALGRRSGAGNSGSIAEIGFQEFGDFGDIGTVSGLTVPYSQRPNCLIINSTCAPGYFLGTGDLQALAVLDDLDELAGLKQALMGAGIEPCITPPH